MNKGHTIPVLNLGYVRYIDHMGSDQRIVESARISYLSPSKGPEGDKKLLHYLYKHQHTSPFEQCSITFNIKMPIFIARQFLRHRTFRVNEVSGRYTEMKDEFYEPTIWRRQDTKNKQGSLGVLGEGSQEEVAELYHSSCKRAFSDYESLLYLGVSREMARMVLPLSTFTEVYVNCDLRNLLHFLRLRQDGHAQQEMQEVANAMAEVVKELFPWTWEAYNKYKIKVVEE